MNETADGNYSLSLDPNDSLETSILSLDANSFTDNDGKPSESFRKEIYTHQLVYEEEYLLSCYFINGTRIRHLELPGMMDIYQE